MEPGWVWCCVLVHGRCSTQKSVCCNSPIPVQIGSIWLGCCVLVQGRCSFAIQNKDTSVAILPSPCMEYGRIVWCFIVIGRCSFAIQTKTKGLRQFSPSPPVYGVWTGCVMCICSRALLVCDPRQKSMWQSPLPVYGTRMGWVLCSCSRALLETKRVCGNPTLPV